MMRRDLFTADFEAESLVIPSTMIARPTDPVPAADDLNIVRLSPLLGSYSLKGDEDIIIGTGGYDEINMGYYDQKISDMMIFSLGGNDQMQIEGELNGRHDFLVFGGTGDDNLTAIAAVVYGGDDEDNLTSWGGGLEAVLIGGAGADALSAYLGGGGLLIGGDGDDELSVYQNVQRVYEPGEAVLFGGAGDDTFEFEIADQTEIFSDHYGLIMDFEAGDRIEMYRNQYLDPGQPANFPAQFDTDFWFSYDQGLDQTLIMLDPDGLGAFAVCAMAGDVDLTVADITIYANNILPGF